LPFKSALIAAGSDQTELMKRVRLGRIGAKNGIANPLCFGEPAAALMLDCGVEPFRTRRHRDSLPEPFLGPAHGGLMTFSARKIFLAGFWVLSYEW